MNIKLKNTNRKRVFNLPCCIFDNYIKPCDEAQLKVLLCFYACDEDSMTSEQIAEITGLTLNDVNKALQFWIEKNELIDCDVVASASVEAPAKTVKLPAIKLSEYVKDNARFKDLVNETEDCLGRTLTQYEKQTLALLREYYKFSDTAIMLIVMHCSKREHFSAGYGEAVAKNLHDKGIITYELIEQEFTAADEYYSFEGEVKRALGLNSKLSKKQAEFLSQWKEMGFGVDMIALAGDICLNSTNKIAFPYMNKIILGWADKKLFTVEEVEADNKALTDNKKADKTERSFDLGEFDDFTLGDYIKK